MIIYYKYQNMAALLKLFGVIAFSLMMMSSANAGERLEPITPLPKSVHGNQDKINLGKQLFTDPKLSGDGTISCASCHLLQNAGVDGLSVARGVKGRLSSRNTPTVYNSAFQFAFFWDGRAETLEEQVGSPLTNPTEMDSNWLDVLHYLQSTVQYQQQFKRSFPDGITQDNVIEAIAAFERSLITPNSRFDRYLRNEEDLTADEKAGYALFKDLGCISCHQGMMVGGNLYEKLGVVKPYYGGAVDEDEAQYGRFYVTRQEENKFEFKVPSLRNVSLTAPYFHDGSIRTLKEAVQLMSYHQLGYRISEQEVGKILSFLETLNGEFPEIKP